MLLFFLALCWTDFDSVPGTNSEILDVMLQIHLDIITPFVPENMEFPFTPLDFTGTLPDR